MDNLAKKLINDHRNPIVKVDLLGAKLFLKSTTQEESQFIEKHQINLENILNHERAERRCARSHATWLPEDNLAKVTKAIKTLNNFGYQDKNGTYLYPEETLFLMETNRLEVTINDVPLSIQEAYNFLLKCPECDATKYRVYKKLALLGYKVLRYSELHRRLNKTAKKLDQSVNSSMHNERKRILVAESDEVNIKRQKVSDADSQSSPADIVASTSSRSNTNPCEYISNLFKKLRQNAPREYENNVTEDILPQYCVFLPSNKSRCNYDFNLYICEDSILNTNHPNNSTPSIFAICSQGNISFHRFANVKLPFL